LTTDISFHFVSAEGSSGVLRQNQHTHTHTHTHTIL